MIKYTLFFIFILTLFSSLQLNAQTNKTGSIWVSPVLIDKRALESKNTNCCVDGEYSIQIDNGDKYNVRKDSSICISKLALNITHYVKIRCQNKIIASFKFSFKKEDSPELCLWFNDLYCSWSLWPLKDAKHLCRCRSTG